MCPDAMDMSKTCTNDVFSVSGKNVNRKQQVSFTRPFTTSKRNANLYFITVDKHIILLAVCSSHFFLSAVTRLWL